MANKQNNSDKITGNGSNTAVYILHSKGNKQADEDLLQLSEICFKSNNPLTLYVEKSVKSTLLEELQQNSKVEICEGGLLKEDIKNVLPLSLPLSNDADQICRWAAQANKAFNGNNMVAALGRPGSKSGYFEKYLAYWSNFWPKFFTGANTNLSACEAVILSLDDFKDLVIGKKISNAWQLASLGEKAGVCTKVPFEYRSGDFVFGDGIKSFFSGLTKGLSQLSNSFLKGAQIRREPINPLDINHSRYKRIFGITAACLLAFMCFISFDYNVTWDEPNHNTYSKDVLKYYSSLGADTTMFDFQKPGHRDYFTNVFYGMSIDVAAAGINSLLSPDTSGQSSPIGSGGTPHPYNDYHVRHLLNTITGFLCILFTALIVRFFSGWLPALVALIAMVCSPSFFGHCFNNPKDIPFAAGYIMAIYYLLKMLRELPNPLHQTKVMLAISIGFAISIRVQGVLPLAYVFGLVGLHWLINQSGKKDKKVMVYLKHTLVVALAAYGLGILFWPFALRQPLQGVIRALTEFEKFSYLTYYELFEGIRIFHKPWYYEPKLIFLTAPLAVLGGSLLGVLLAWFKKAKGEKFLLFFLLLATIFPAVYAIYKESYVYNGWRHFIFIYPPLMAVAILGWYWLIQLIKNKKAQLALWGLIVISFLKPGIWSIANHPYQYMYFNEIAGGVQGAQGQYELDYWNQTPRAAFEWLVKNHPEVLKGELKVSSNNIQESLKTYVPEGQNVKYAWTREYEWADNDWTYAIWTTRTLSRNQIIGGYWPPKGTIHEIKVDGVCIAAVVKSENNYGYMGKQYLKKNKADSAIYFYEKALAYNPLEEEYARGLANACRFAEKYDSAIQFYEKAMALRDGNYEAMQSLGEIYYTLAMIKNRENPDKAMMDKAFDYLGLALKHKKNASAPLYMGDIRLIQNNPLEAKNYYNIFLQTYGNVGRGYLGLAKSQLLLGETDSAFYNLQGAIQFEPKNPEAYGILGNELQKAGRSKEAEQFLNEYMKLSGMSPQ